MTDRSEWYEYGYRLEDGTESWQINHGTDGSWTAHDAAHNIAAIDMYDGSEVEAIYAALDEAGVAGIALRKLITRFEGEWEAVYRA